MEMEKEIISREYIKPARPTPDNLRIHKFSVIDQLCAHVYVPYIFLYNSNSNSDVDDLDHHRRRLLTTLKNSLSQTLTSFYPFAGQVIKDDLHVLCNDNGVYYVEARIKNKLSDFLKHPEPKFIYQLLPYHPHSQELMSSQTFVITIQVSIFSCGGFAIGYYSTHKIIDAFSITAFLKAWAATARGYPDLINPNFDAQSIFPQIPTLPENASLVMWPPLYQRPKCVSRRFLFEASAFAGLKAKASSVSVKNPSRVVSVIGLIWKSAMAASKLRCGYQKASVLSVAVNLRSKISSQEAERVSIGNLIWFGIAESRADSELEVSSVVGCLVDAIGKVDDNFVKELKGVKTMGEILKKREQVYSDNEAEYYVATSLCNAGFEQVDFGCGKPVWKCHGAPDLDNPGLTNLIFLTDSEDSVGGIEVLVSLNEDDMRVLEGDPELLAFASIMKYA